MSSSDSAIEDFLSTNPGDFKVLVRLELRNHQPTERSPVLLGAELELRPFDVRDKRRLLISFIGVRDLNLTQPEWSEFEISGLSVISIRENQWEGLNYKVVTDNSVLSFLCDRFEVSLSEH